MKKFRRKIFVHFTFDRWRHCQRKASNWSRERLSLIVCISRWIHAKVIWCCEMTSRFHCCWTQWVEPWNVNRLFLFMLSIILPWTLILFICIDHIRSFEVIEREKVFKFLGQRLLHHLLRRRRPMIGWLMMEIRFFLRQKKTSDGNHVRFCSKWISPEWFEYPTIFMNSIFIIDTNQGRIHQRLINVQWSYKQKKNEKETIDENIGTF